MKSSPIPAGAIPVKRKTHRGLFRMSSLCGAFGLLLAGLNANAQETWPVNGVSEPKDACYAFTHATIIKDAQTTLSNATLVIRDGKIVAAGPNAAIPKDAVVIDCKGKYIYPSFVDIYSDYGMPAQQRGGRVFGAAPQMFTAAKGAVGWNQAIKSEVNAIQLFSADEPKAKNLREAGFGTVLTHQADGIARGTGALVTLSSEKESQTVIREKASAHYSFDKGSSTQETKS